MKHKVAELEGALLDAAVAKAEGRLVTPADDHPSQPGYCEKSMREWSDFVVRWYAESGEEGGWEAMRNQGSPSTEWEIGGPIIEKWRIDVSSPDEWTDDLRWYAGIYESKTLSGTRMMYEQRGDTPLIAAMRAYVASKFGDEVEL